MLRTILFFLSFACLPTLASEPVLVGQVENIVDGDTVDVRLESDVVRVRLHGIDTPERGQVYYKEASEALTRLIGERQVELAPVGQSSYERMVARVYRGDLDVNAEMLRLGMAYAETRYLKQMDDGASYCAFEYAARSLKRGVWGLPEKDRVAPWDSPIRTKKVSRTSFAGETTASCITAIGKQR